MAIAKVVYKENASATPEVWMDTTQKTVTSGTMLSGTTALKNDGTGITGNIASKSSSDLTASGATVTAPAGYYSSSASKSVASGSATTPSTSITANPTISVNASGLITASVSGSKSVTPTVSAGYVTSGTAGTVSVSGSNTEQLSTQAGTTITPTESEQTAVASGKFTTGAVKVGAISSTYVGSGITQRDSTDLTASGATVIAPAGYYAEAASKSVASGSAGTPTATKGTVSSHSVSVTPSVTNTTGYITGGTLTGTAVTVSASELVSGTKSITSSGTTDVTNYASASVAAGTAGTPTATKGTVSNHSISVTPSVTNTTGYITGSTISGTAVTIDVTELESGTKSITANGTGISVSGYSAVDVDVAGQTPTGVKYIYTDTDGNGAWNVAGYEYCAVDGAPVGGGVINLWLTVPEDALSVKVYFYYSSSVQQTISWGDGTTETATKSGGTTNNHTYSQAGNYVVTVINTGVVSNYIMGQSSASDNKLVYAELPYSTLSNNKNAVFMNCVNLKKAYIQDGMTAIGTNYFNACSSLKSVRFPSSLETLGSGTFKDCISLDEIETPSGVQSIPSNFVQGCTSMSKVTINSSVTSIGTNALVCGSSTNKTTFVLLPTNPPVIQSSTFQFSDIEKIIVPQGCLSAYQSATNWSILSSKMVEETA